MGFFVFWAYGSEGGKFNSRKEGAKIQMELAHEAEETQFEPGSNERKIA